ncbi:hypothetical protein MAL08_03180 [Leptospira noguchii]|uniref:hypothetical protein n=1 Tax=Leptospira noguchii TaxID=28182 RepID=UPI001FB7ABEE|nr:hypothetical protein [Leptospira noguchii]UOG38353.1 hypothetical protein MAL08_03180 [Leptospira noguchii]
MKRFLRKRLKLKHNVLYHNLTHKLNRILESKLNSAKRFPKLSVSLPMGRSTGRVGNSAQRFPKGRVVGSKTHIFQVFRQE